MRTAVTLVILVLLTYSGPAVAQDLPPDILADQYLLEATEALEGGDAQAAIRAFQRIEGLDAEPPLEFLYFYGKLLVENGTTLDDVLKGESLLKQYVLNIEKDSAHYVPTLKLLSVAGNKLGEIDTQQKTEVRVNAIISEFSARARELNLPLMHYAGSDDARYVVAELILRGDANAMDKHGSPPRWTIATLRTAAGEVACEVVAELIARGADVNAVDEDGEPPLWTAVSEGYIEMGLCLIDSGANVNVTDEHGATALNIAARRNDFEFAKLLIDRGAQINRGGDVYHESYTPLHSAADYLSYEVAKLLIDQGARVNAHSRLVQRPLCRVYSGIRGDSHRAEKIAALLRQHGGTCMNVSICSKHKC